MLSVTDNWEHDFLLCLYHTAARRAEIIRLTWDDIDLEKRQITLWTRKRKGGALESDQLYINDGLKNILEKRLQTRSQDPDCQYVFPGPDGGPKSKNTIDKLMPRLCKEADVKPFGLHAIRHFAAIVMMDSKELSLVDIQKMLRQKRATTTDVYLNQLAKSKTTAADILGNIFNEK